MALDQGVVDGVTNANFKTLAEMQTVNILAHQNRLQMIAESSVGQILNKMNGLDPTEAAAVTKVAESGLGAEIAKLGAAVASIQQSMKGAQTTLPETGKQG